MMKRIFLATVLVSALVMTGCSSLRAPAKGTNVGGGADGVVNFALTYQGAPYRYGGTSPAGFDCSGFVSYVFSNVASLQLPRSAEGMYGRGAAVDVADLKPGDLVFFNTLSRPLSHVGIYIGNGQFVHATSSGTKRVMVSSLGESYWTRHYNGARRVLGGGAAPNVALN